MNFIGVLLLQIVGDFYFFIQNYERCDYVFIKKGDIGLEYLKNGEEFDKTIQKILKDHATMILKISEDNPTAHLFYIYEFNGEFYVEIERFLNIYYQDRDIYDSYKEHIDPNHHKIKIFNGCKFIHLPRGKEFF